MVPIAFGDGFQTRRTFLKTSAFTLGAAAVLSRGTALADNGGNSNVQFQWGLVCVSDPTIPGANPEEYQKIQGTGTSVWWVRAIATWDAGDDAVAMHLRGVGPNAVSRSADGSLAITDSVVKGSFTVQGSLKACINNDADDGDGYWQGVFDGIGWNNDNLSDDIIAVKEVHFQPGILSINGATGEVSYSPKPLMFEKIQEACELDLLDDDSKANQKFQLIGGGCISPAIQIKGGAARSTIDSTTEKIGVKLNAGVQPGQQGGAVAGAEYSYEMTFTNLPVSVQKTLSWNFHKVRRQIQPTLGPWLDAGFAWPANFSATEAGEPAEFVPSAT